MKLKYITLPAYLVAFTLVAFPILETTLRVWPLRFDEVGWRFGTTGIFSAALMTPALGLLVAYVTAMVMDHRRTVRGLAIVGAIVCVLLLAAVPMFLLDGLQMRSTVRADAKTAFDVSTVVAVVKMLFGIVIAMSFAWYGFRASRRDPTVIRAEARPAATLVGR